MLSNALPLPSLPIMISSFFKYSIQPEQVNWDPWSELIISGLPYVEISSFNTPSVFSASRVLNKPQPTIYRLYTSIMAVRYRKQRFMGMYVKPMHHTWLQCVISNPLLIIHIAVIFIVYIMSKF